MKSFLAVLVVCTLAVIAFEGSPWGHAGAAQAAPMTWKVAIGGETPDHAIKAQDYFPRAITINAGDTITWTKATLLPHTVHFLSGTKPPEEVVPQKDGKLLFNPAIVNPQGGKTYDGKGMAASGFLPFEKGLTYSLTFTKPGTYTYVCAIHHGMAGTVTVLASGAKVPTAQSEYDAAGAKQLAQELEQGQRLLASQKLSATKTAKGTVYVSSLAGSAGAYVSSMRFAPEPITIKAGDTVRWDMKDPFEIHAVTFSAPNEPPAFIIPEQQPQGPPKVYFNPKVMAPAGGGVMKGLGYYNSGVLVPPPAPGGPHSYSVTFTKPGTYTYWCVVHVPVGMRGTVVVQ